MERCRYCFKPLPENGICDCDYENSANAEIEDALDPGTIVGACYQIGAVLGKGGFGITYRGYDLAMKRIVAIKEFFPSGMVTRGRLLYREGRDKSEVYALTETGAKTYKKSLELFYREAQALGRLNKLPNVVHAYHIFRENGTAYIVMDFIEGEPLSKIIRERGHIPESELIPLLDPIPEVLDKVHEMGILHRDIAPDNIMIENGQPILLDFGAARVQGGHTSSLLIGKPGYSSPEQLAGTPLDGRSDLYSLGATYYKALSGETPLDSMKRKIRDQVIPLNVLVPEISPRINFAVMKAIALDADDRWDTAGEFRDALHSGQGIVPAGSVLNGTASPDLSGPASPDGKTDIQLRGEEDDAVTGRIPGNDDGSAAAAEGPAYKPDGAKDPAAGSRTEAGSGNGPARKPKKMLWLIPVILALVCAAAYFLFGRDLLKKTAGPAGSETFEFGHYEQDNDLNNGAEAIEWLVLKEENGRRLVISKYALESGRYNESRTAETWETCSLRRWLNEEFYESAFSDEEKGRILEVSNENPDNPKYGTNGGDKTEDRIFLLNIDEANTYFETSEARLCKMTAYAKAEEGSDGDHDAALWWLRSPGNHRNTAAYVDRKGRVVDHGESVITDGYGVRPAFWIEEER